MRIVVTTEPTGEPLTLDEVKAHCRIDLDDDDSLLTSLIVASRQFVEQHTELALMEQVKTVYYDLYDNPFKCSVLNLPIKPVSAIESVVVQDSDFNQSTAVDTTYALSGDRFVFKDSFVYPDTESDVDCLAIEATVGYADADSVPQSIKQAMLMLIAHWYENRETVFDPMSNAPNRTMMPYGVTALLQPYRTIRL